MTTLAIRRATRQDAVRLLRWYQQLAETIPLGIDLHGIAKCGEQELQDNFEAASSWADYWIVEVGNESLGWFELLGARTGQRTAMVQGWVEPRDSRARWRQAVALRQVVRAAFQVASLEEIHVEVSSDNRPLLEAYFLNGFETTQISPYRDRRLLRLKLLRGALHDAAMRWLLGEEHATEQ